MGTRAFLGAVRRGSGVIRSIAGADVAPRLRALECRKPSSIVRGGTWKTAPHGPHLSAREVALQFFIFVVDVFECFRIPPLVPILTADDLNCIRHQHRRARATGLVAIEEFRIVAQRNDLWGHDLNVLENPLPVPSSNETSGCQYPEQSVHLRLCTGSQHRQVILFLRGFKFVEPLAY